MRPSTNGASAAILRHCSTSASVRIGSTRYIEPLLLARRRPVEGDEQGAQRPLEIVVGHQPQPNRAARPPLDRDRLDVVERAEGKCDPAAEAIGRAGLLQ